MKKVFLTMLALLLTLIVSACGGNSSQETSQVESTGSESNTTGGESSTTEDTKGTISLDITLGGASPGGFWSLLGEGLGNIIREVHPGTQFSYETGNGVKNVIDVADEQITLGMGHNFEISAALKGEEPFKSQINEVTALFTLYDNAAHQMVITKEFADKYGINSFEDIVNKKPPIRVAVNQRGNLLEAINRNAFDSYGFNYSDIESWGGEIFYVAWKPSIDMMGDNKVDLIGASVFAPDGKLLELTTSKEIKLLPLNQNAQELINERMGMSKGVIKQEAYDFMTEDIETVNAAAILMAGPNMSEDDAYTITKTVMENLDKYKALHNKLADLTPEIMADVSPAKLHPGALKYFKEIGAVE